MYVAIVDWCCVIDTSTTSGLQDNKSYCVYREFMLF